MQAHEPAETSSGDAVPRPDIATTVALTLRHMGVAGLPRNYELLYEAITGANKELSDALSAAGSRPTQKQLDEIARAHLVREDPWQVDEARQSISRKLDDILALLRKERMSMETYGKILGETSTGLNSRQAITRDFLDKIISVASTATRSSIENRSRIVSSISDKSGELKDVQSKLEEYKRLANTDALTQLSNRRAFDRSISSIYDNNRGVAFSALILADIDRFKSVNDRFGHPVGDRILQIVASILRANVKEDAFVARTGGEEFAIILEGYGEDATFKLAEDLRKAVMDAPFINVSTGMNYGPITMSFGTCMATQAQGPDDLYIKADKALYASKAGGRNRATRFSMLSEGSFTKSWLLYKKG